MAQAQVIVLITNVLIRQQFACGLVFCDAVRGMAEMTCNGGKARETIDLRALRFHVNLIHPGNTGISNVEVKP